MPLAVGQACAVLHRLALQLTAGPLLVLNASVSADH